MKAPTDKPQSGKVAVRAQIEENLKRVYDVALNEEIPDRFTDLLSQLRAKDSQT